MKKLLPIFVITILLVGGGAFYGGMKYGQAKKPSFNSGQFGSQMPSGGPFQGGLNSKGALNGNRNGSSSIGGEIMAKDDKSITVKSQDGSSKIIFYSDSTEISKFTSGTLSDLAIGENVMVSGKASQDGSITAQSIQIRPAVSQQP